MHNTNIPCGCLIEYEGDQFHQDYSIDWCPLHKAAPALLEALRNLTFFMRGYLTEIPTEAKAHFEAAGAAIAKATKE